ncbi:Mechanosensitive ion channel-domain-containing protein [Crucibulum laeve]|uniref:Mechanosensitive ion channel-domain-containing protein n=1 Tax=Crucibulum laeve TaxID=68775 RepID=A0A5C3MD49_9AGAR|nr:Mechanosensitive ion channel-domain-containing protein [Crucibulum laeve]
MISGRASPPAPLLTARHHNHDFFAASTEDLPASPPYRPIASTSSLHINHLPEYPPSPAYDSRVNILMNEPVKSEKAREKERAMEVGLGENEPSPTSAVSEGGNKSKLAVHYPEDTKRSASLPLPSFLRQDSADIISSRPSSLAGTDDEDSSDYDWSGEDDLVDQEANFEKQHMGIKTKPEGWGVKRILTLLFGTLLGSALLAGVFVTPAILIHFYWYKPHPTESRRYIKDNVQSWLFWAAANLVISWALAMIIDIVPVVTRLIISGVWGHVSEFVKTRMELYNSSKDTIKPAFYAGSAWLSWVIIFGSIFDLYNSGEPEKSRAPYTPRVAQVVEFCFFLALVWCIQRMLSHFIAFSFHRTAYKERVEAVEEALGVIEKLRDYRPKFHTPRSGTRTPAFGFMTPFSEKDHFNYLSGALRDATPPPSRSHARFASDDADDADVEDADRTMVNPKSKKGKNRHSWFGSGENKPLKSGTSSTDEYVQKRGIDNDIELMPPSSVSTSRPGTPSQFNPHRYPPSPKGSPRQSVDTHTPSGEGGDTLVQAAKAIKNAILHDARNIGGNDDSDAAALSWNVGSSKEAKRLARSIYMRFKDRRRIYLLPSDFYPAFPDHESAEAGFRVFDKDNNGDISRAEVKSTLLRVYKERRFLSRSMKDVSEALTTLNQILLFFAAVILFFISLSVFGVEVGDSLTSVYSIGIAASFIFKNAASSAFDAIMFLFVTHPYDTGDRCFIDNENLVVKKVGLFATVFSRVDGTETYYFNSQLFNKFITNVRRSGKTFENLTMQVAWRTPLEKLDALEKHLNDWLSTEENRWFEPSTNITFQHIVYQRYLELTIGIGHNGNWQDWGLRMSRKTAFHTAVQYYCRQLGIIGYEAPLPIVYGDPISQRYNPLPSPGIEEPLSPNVSTPVTEQHRREEAEELDRLAKNMKPSLGFLPPLATRSAHLSRARKSKHKKVALRGIDG